MKAAVWFVFVLTFIGLVNEVTLRRAGLLLRWVTVRGTGPYCLGI